MEATLLVFVFYSTSLLCSLQVYVVEASSVAEHTEKQVKLNGCDDVVTVFCSIAEDLMLPSKVDVLVSEWMGNCLLV